MAIKTLDVVISAATYTEFIMPPGAISLLIRNRNNVDMDVADSDGGNVFTIPANQSQEFKNNFHEGGIAELKEGESIFLRTVLASTAETLAAGAV